MSELVTTASSAHIKEIRGLYFPHAGGWRADVELDGGELPSGAATLTTGSLSLVGTVERADFDKAGKPHAIVVGGIGWQGLVGKPLSFQSDVGVKLSTVLDAIASGAGQKIERPSDATIGNYYELVATRDGEPVRWADALGQLVRNGYVAPWRLDPDGVTRFGARTPKEVTARATLIHRDASTGTVTYGVDDPSEFLPGNTIEGVTIYDITIRETSKHLEIDVRTEEPKGTPSIRDLLRRVLAAWLGESVRTYVVASVGSDGRLDLVPPSDAPHLPEMSKVEQWTIGGIEYLPTPGEEVAVLFLDDKRTRPVAIGIKLASAVFAGIARLGDSVVVMLPPATFTGTIGGSPASGMVVWAPGQTMGTITTASAKSKAGP